MLLLIIDSVLLCGIYPEKVQGHGPRVSSLELGIVGAKMVFRLARRPG